MSSLPTEVDFTANPAATPSRMDLAMTYLIARIKAIEALAPDYQSAINALNAIGLSRITEVLSPLFTTAQGIAAAIQTIYDTIQADSTLAAIEAEVAATVTATFADYRNNYLGAKSSAPTARPDGSPVVVGCLYFDTTLDQMQVLGSTGWKNAGSSVAGVMKQITPIVATAGQTSFTVPGGYDSGYLIVTVNGIVIPPSDYTATDGSTVVLSVALTAGDEFGGVAFGAVTLASIYTKAQADARFAQIGDAYTKAQSDAAYALIGAAYTKAQSDGRYPNLTLSNLTDAAAARGNLGVGSAGTRADSYFLKSTDATTGGNNANGFWEKRANGYIEQWGYKAGPFTEGEVTMTWPVGFVTSMDAFNATAVNASSDVQANTFMQIKSWNATGCVVFVQTTTGNGIDGFFWNAKGK